MTVTVGMAQPIAGEVAQEMALKVAQELTL